MSRHTKPTEDKDIPQQQRHEQHAPRPVPPTRSPVHPDPSSRQHALQQKALGRCPQTDWPPSQAHREVPASLASGQTAGPGSPPSVLSSGYGDTTWPSKLDRGHGSGISQRRRKQQPQQSYAEHAEDKDCCDSARRRNPEAGTLRPQQHDRSGEPEGQIRHGRMEPESVCSQTNALLPIQLLHQPSFLANGTAGAVVERKPASPVRSARDAPAVDAQSETPGSIGDSTSRGRKESPQKVWKGEGATTAFPCFWVDSSPLSQSSFVSTSAFLPDAGDKPKCQLKITSGALSTFSNRGEQSTPAKYRISTRHGREGSPSTSFSNQIARENEQERKLPAYKVFASPTTVCNKEAKEGGNNHRRFRDRGGEECKHFRDSKVSDKEEAFINDGGGDTNGKGESKRSCGQREQVVSYAENKEGQCLEDTGPRGIGDTSLQTCVHPVKQEGSLLPDQYTPPSAHRQGSASFGQEKSEHLIGKSFEFSVGKESKSVIGERSKIMSKEFIFREESENESAKSFVGERTHIKTGQETEYLRDGSDFYVKKDSDPASDKISMARVENSTAKSERYGIITSTHGGRRDEEGITGRNMSDPTATQFRAYPWLCAAPLPNAVQTDPTQDRPHTLDSHPEQDRPVRSVLDPADSKQERPPVSAARRPASSQWSAQNQVASLQIHDDTGTDASDKGKKQEPTGAASQKYPTSTDTADKEQQKFPLQAQPSATRRSTETEHSSLLYISNSKQGSSTKGSATSGNKPGGDSPVVRTDTAACNDKEGEEARDKICQTPSHPFSTQINESAAATFSASERTIIVCSELAQERDKDFSHSAKVGLSVKAAQSGPSDCSTSAATSSRRRKRKEDAERVNRGKGEDKERQKGKVEGTDNENTTNEAAERKTDGSHTRRKRRKKETGEQLTKMPEDSASSVCESPTGGNGASQLGNIHDSMADGTVSTLDTDVQWRILFEASLPVTPEMTDASEPQLNAYFQENIRSGAEFNGCLNEMTVEQEFDEGDKEKNPSRAVNSLSSQSFKFTIAPEKSSSKTAMNCFQLGDKNDSSIRTAIDDVLQLPNPQHSRSRRKQKIPRQFQHHSIPKRKNSFSDKTLSTDFSQKSGEADAECSLSCCGSSANSSQMGKSSNRVVHTVSRPQGLDERNAKSDFPSCTHSPSRGLGQTSALDCPAQEICSRGDATGILKLHASGYSQAGLDLTVIRTRKTEQHNTAAHAQDSVPMETCQQVKEESLLTTGFESNSKCYSSEKKESSKLFIVRQDSEHTPGTVQTPPINMATAATTRTTVDTAMRCRFQTTFHKNIKLGVKLLKNDTGRMKSLACLEDHPLLQSRPKFFSFGQIPKSNGEKASSYQVPPADIILPKRTSSAKSTLGLNSALPSKSKFPTAVSEFPLSICSPQIASYLSPTQGRDKEHGLRSVLPHLQLLLSHPQTTDAKETKDEQSPTWKMSLSQEETALDLRLNHSREEPVLNAQVVSVAGAHLNECVGTRTGPRASAEWKRSERRQESSGLCPGKLSKSIQDVMTLKVGKVGKRHQRARKPISLQHLILTPLPTTSVPNQETLEKIGNIIQKGAEDKHAELRETISNLALNNTFLPDTKNNGSTREQLTQSRSNISNITFLTKDDPKQQRPRRLPKGHGKKSTRRTAKDSKNTSKSSDEALRKIEKSSVSPVPSTLVPLTTLVTQDPAALVPIKADPLLFRSTSTTLASRKTIADQSVPPTTAKAMTVTVTTVRSTSSSVLGFPCLPLPIYSPACGLRGISSPLCSPPLPLPIMSTSATSSHGHIQQSHLIPIVPTMPIVVPALQTPVTEENEVSPPASASLAPGNQPLSCEYAAVSRFFPAVSLHSGQDHETLTHTAMSQLGITQIEMSQIGLVSSEVLAGSGGRIPILFFVTNTGQDLPSSPIQLEQMAVSTATPEVATSSPVVVKQEAENPQIVKNSKIGEDGCSAYLKQTHAENGHGNSCFPKTEPTVQTSSPTQDKIARSATQALNNANLQLSTAECKEEKTWDDTKAYASPEIGDKKSDTPGIISNDNKGDMVTTSDDPGNGPLCSPSHEMKKDEANDLSHTPLTSGNFTTEHAEGVAEISAVIKSETLSALTEANIPIPDSSGHTKPVKVEADEKPMVKGEVPGTVMEPLSPTPLVKSSRKRTASTRYSFPTDFDFSDVSDSGEMTTPATSDDDWTPDQDDVGQEAMSSEEEEDPLQRQRQRGQRSSRKDALHEMFTMHRKRPAARATRHQRQQSRRNPAVEGLASSKFVLSKGHGTQTETEKTQKAKDSDRTDRALPSRSGDQVSGVADGILVKQVNSNDEQRLLPKQHQPQEDGCQVSGKCSPHHSPLASTGQRRKRRKTPYTAEDLSCRLCGKMFVNIYRLKRHESSHGNERPFLCEVCGKAFKQSGHRNEHRMTHSALKRSFLCNVCGVVIGSRSSFRYHIMSHKQYGDGIVDTAACEITMHTLEVKGKEGAGGRSTVDQVSSIGMAAYDCPHCEERFATAQSLNCHLETHLEVEVRCHVQPFICTECGRSFTYRHNLEKHRECHVSSETRAHNYQRKVQDAIASGKPHFVCDTCGKVYLRKETLSKHLKTHLGLKPFKCGVCFKSFTQKVHLTVHSRLHTGSRPFQCRTCRCCFLDSTALARHVERDVCNSNREGLRFSVGKRGSKSFSGQDAAVKTGFNRKKGGGRTVIGKSLRCGLCGWSGKHIGFLMRHVSRCHPHQTDKALLDSNGRTSSKTDRRSSKGTETDNKSMEANTSLNEVTSVNEARSIATSSTSTTTSVQSSVP